MCGDEAKPGAHVFDVELGNIHKYLSLPDSDFVFRQTLKQQNQ